MSKEDKSKAIEDMLEQISYNFSMPRTMAFKSNHCVMCGGEAKEFRDEASEREYKISGMCQVCQDSFFE